MKVLSDDLTVLIIVETILLMLGTRSWVLDRMISALLFYLLFVLHDSCIRSTVFPRSQ